MLKTRQNASQKWPFFKNFLAGVVTHASTYS